ncbi:uncharacterized protein At4g19900-like [Silene latifolia]|uniref:uncharacterized protein At4g19900-like n=1 Tax=Silene latifolia TaxID=37657 RepID=UPI003D770707
MKMRKFSIPSSFVSVCWFSSLFAICLFSFLYLHPRDADNCLNILKINSSDTIISQSSKYDVSNETNLTPNVTNLVPMTESKSNDSVIELPTSNQDAPVAASNEPPPSNPTSNQVDGYDPTKIEEESDEEYDKIPSIDVFANPPWNCSREERILWLKEKLQESKLVKSTSRTQNIDEKIQVFLTNCRVRIFLTWIYPANLFGKREIFALESMLKAHFEGCVVILSRSMDSNPGRSILKPILDRGLKVLTLAPDFHYLFSETPAQGWFERLESGEVDPGTVPITVNLSNLLRLAVLYKYGGVYFDSDMIIIKDVSGLRNMIGVDSVDRGMRSWQTVGNAVLIFDKGHPLLWRFMEEFTWNFDGFKWGFGPEMATRAVSKAVNDSNFHFHVMVPLGFYPIDPISITRLFEKPSKNGPNWVKNKFGEINGESYGIHLWNRQTHGLKIEKKSVIGRLISNHCILCQDVYDS